MLSRVSHMTMLSVVTCVVNVEIQRAKRGSQAPVHLVTDRQVCSLTKECQVYQFVPGTSISRQFVSILLTILQHCQVPLRIVAHIALSRAAGGRIFVFRLSFALTLPHWTLFGSPFSIRTPKPGT